MREVVGARAVLFALGPFVWTTSADGLMPSRWFSNLCLVLPGSETVIGGPEVDVTLISQNLAT